MSKHLPARGRRWQATLIIALFFVAVVAAAAGGWWYARESPPHQGPLLLITVDELAPRSLAALGAERPANPSIDALAAESVVFDRAYAHGLQVLPSYASLMTGQLPFQHGVRDDGGFTLKPEARTLAEVLKNRGFNTGAAVSSFLLRRETGMAQGFNFFDAEVPDGPRREPVLGRSGDATIDAAERWARLQAGQRYFLMLQVPADTADVAVRRLTDLLRERKLYDDATIVLVGDRPVPSDDGNLDDAALQIPLLVKQPDGEGAGRHVAIAVQQVDVLPTILDFVRAPMPGGVRGHSLRAILDSDRATLAPRPLYAEWLLPYFRFGGRPIVTTATDSDQPIAGPSLIAAADEDRLALAGYLPGLFPPGPPSDDLTDAEQRAITETHRQAALLAGDRKFSGAIRLLQELAATHPDLAQIHYQLGLLLVRSGRTDEAINEFRTAADLRPDAIDVPMALADALLHLGRSADAAEAADSAVMLAGSAPPARVSAAHAIAARVALARKDADAAMHHAAAAEKADPAVPMQNFVRGRLLYDEGKYDEAVGPFEDAANAARKSGAAVPDLHLYLGDTLTRLDRTTEAEPEFREELRAFPHNLEAYASLAMLYRSSDRDGEVEDVLDELVESTSTPEGYAMAAKLWTALGERSRAEALRSDARARFRGDPSLVLLGRDGRR
jgi:tetratricopeptide (TPR) repeat protein